MNIIHFKGESFCFRTNVLYYINASYKSFADPLLVIFEYIPNGDLLGYLKKSLNIDNDYHKDPHVKPQTSLTTLQLMKFSWQIADGMEYLSSKEVIFFKKKNLKGTNDFEFFSYLRNHLIFIPSVISMHVILSLFKNSEISRTVQKFLQ